MTAVALEAPELLERIAGGDDVAFAALYDRYRCVAYGLALRVVGDAALAEDVVQEAFLGAWRSAGSFRPGSGTERACLLTIVHRRAVDVVRRAGRPVPPPPEPIADGDFADACEHDRARRALASLPACERQTLELAYYLGLTQSEIAAALLIPIGTVKSRTQRALSRLRDLLEEAQ